MKSTLASISLLGTRVTNASEAEILEYIIKGLKKEGKKVSILTLNPEIIVFARKHATFQEVVNSAGLGLPDGIGVIWAGKIFGKNLPGRVTGVDLMEKLCKRAAKEGFTVGLIGGKGTVADRAAECLRKKYPGLKISFAKSGGEIDEERMQSITKIPPTDMLFVAFGFPKQEFWIAENLPNIPVKAVMGVGGAFDFVSGEVPRAPKLVQDLGFEWLFRLVVEPWRWYRQLALLAFVFLVLQERVALLFGKRNTIIEIE